MELVNFNYHHDALTVLCVESQKSSLAKISHLLGLALCIYLFVSPTT